MNWLVKTSISCFVPVYYPRTIYRGKYDQGHAVHQDDKTTFKTTRRQDDFVRAGVAVLALVLVFGPRSLRFVEYSPGILLDRFIASGVYALRFTGPHRLATTRFPRRRPFLSSFRMRDSISVDCSARCVHRFARSSGTTSTSEVRAVRGALPAHAAPCLCALVPEPVSSEHARHWKSPPVLISFSEGPPVPGVWSFGPKRAQNRLLSPVCLSMAALHLHGRRSVLRISSRHARRPHFYMRSCSYCLSRPSACSLHPLPWSRGVRRSRCCHSCRHRHRRLREVERALALVDRGEEALLHDCLARVVRQLDIVGTSHNRGQVRVG